MHLAVKIYHHISSHVSSYISCADHISRNQGFSQTVSLRFVCIIVLIMILINLFLLLEKTYLAEFITL